MELNLKEGILIIKELKVIENEIVIKMGLGDLEVYVIFVMIVFMENVVKSLVIE